MQPAQHQAIPAAVPMIALADQALSPAAMASHLRRVSGAAALCFARVMHEESAWANDSWGRYWAEVMQRV